MKNNLIYLFLACAVGMLIGFIFTRDYYPKINDNTHEMYQQLFLELQPKFREAQMTVLAKNAIPLPEDRKGQMLIIDSMFYYNGKAHAFGECQDLIAIKLGLKQSP